MQFSIRIVWEEKERKRKRNRERKEKEVREGEVGKRSFYVSKTLV